MAKNSLTLVDNRTDKTYEIPINDSTIRAKDLRQIKVEEDEFGMMSYDPSFENTASCKSSVTFIDGDKGILRYRGFPIEQLAEHSSQLEVSKLLIDGELPNTQELKRWIQDISDNSYVPEEIQNIVQAFPKNSHPMGALISLIAALSTFYPDAKNIQDSYNLAGQLMEYPSTPTFYLFNHQSGVVEKISGAQPFSVFVKTIDSML